MTKRTLIATLVLALANTAGAVPTVSGDGACGIHAVDNESFVTCEGDRAPEPVAPASGPYDTVLMQPPADGKESPPAAELAQQHGQAKVLALADNADD